MEELRARLRTQEWYHDLSEQGSDEEIQMGAQSEDQGANGENQPGTENRSSARRRARNNAPQRRAPRMNVRAPQVLQPLDETGGSTMTDDPIQQRVQRLVVSQQQCMDRVAQVDTRLEQFRHGIRQDALHIALTPQRVMQDVQGQGQGVEQIRHNLFDIVMEKLETLDSGSKSMMSLCKLCWQRLTNKDTKCVLQPEESSTNKKTFERIVEELARRIDSI